MSAPCAHCGANVDENEPGGANGAYCCAGCAAAHALVLASGLQRYYTIADAPLPTGRSAPSDRAWLDALVARATGGTLVVDVQGITCAACVWVIEELARRHGVHCGVNPGVGRLEIAPAPRAHLDALLDDVERLGYRLGPPRKRADASSDDLLMRTGLCAALAMNAMIFAFSRYFGLSADPHQPGGDDVAAWFRVGEAVLATASVAVGGSWFFKNAGRALVRGIVHLDLPIALGIALAYAGSALSALLSTPDQAYFDTVCMFIALMLFGRLAQRRLLAHSRLLLLADEGLDGLQVRRVVSGVAQVVVASAIRAGDRLLLVPQEILPVAARLMDAAAASLSLAWITGESEARAFAAGDVVPAGAHNVGTRAVIVEATEDMAQSGLHALLASRASDDPDASPFWRRYATLSVFAVLALAAVALVGWWGAGPVRALEVTTAVLVVTCPCAIGLAIPLAAELASAKLRRRGLFIRRAGLLDRMMLVEHVVLDKTGTLTLADLRLDDSSRAAICSLSPDAAQVLFELCARSAHPKSRTVAAALVNTHPHVRLSADLVVEEQSGVGLHAPSLAAAFMGDVFTLAGAELARVRFVEVLQRDAISEVAALGARGLLVHLASGDSAERVRDVAARLGVEPSRAHARMSPQDKAALVCGLGKERVLVIGDGVNDAPAFAVAGCAGTPALDRPQLPARADFVFVGSGVGPLHRMFEVAALLRRASIAAIVFALSYNAVVVTLALSGRMTPLLCAILMPASSLVVVTLVTALMRDRAPHLRANRALDAREVQAA